jgi:hypothetical protein
MLDPDWQVAGGVRVVQHKNPAHVQHEANRQEEAPPTQEEVGPPHTQPYSTQCVEKIILRDRVT